MEAWDSTVVASVCQACPGAAVAVDISTFLLPAGEFFLSISFQTGEKLELRYSIISSAQCLCESFDAFSESDFCSDLHSLTWTSLLIDPVA